MTESLSPGSPAPVAQKVVIYTRVSAAENKGHLEAQAGRLQDYCAAKGWQVAQVVKEIGSGVINQAENGKEDLMQDFVSIVTSLCARLYGQRRCKRKMARIIAELQNDEESGLT